MASPSKPEDTIPPPPRDSDRPTLIPCLECEGQYVTEVRDTDRPGSFRSVFCRWCTNGAMSPAEARAWREARR